MLAFVDQNPMGRVEGVEWTTEGVKGVVLLQANMASDVCEVAFALLLQPGVGAGHCYKWYVLGR